VTEGGLQYNLQHATAPVLSEQWTDTDVLKSRGHRLSAWWPRHQVKV